MNSFRYTGLTRGTDKAEGEQENSLYLRQREAGRQLWEKYKYHPVPSPLGNTRFNPSGKGPDVNPEGKASMHCPGRRRKQERNSLKEGRKPSTRQVQWVDLIQRV